MGERSGKIGFPSAISSVSCFKNCTKLDNYINIPADWK